MLVADAIVGQFVSCSRCERPFEARVKSAASRLGELLLVAAAAAVGVIVAWLLVKYR
jgi:hypothetical protein